MAHTYSPVDVCDALIAVLKTVPEFEGRVYYGQEEVISHTPSATVSAQDLARNLYATGSQTQNEINVEIIIFYSQFGRSEMVTRDCEQFITSLVPVVEADKSLGGLVVFGHIQRITPVGSVNVSNRPIKAGQLLYSATSVTRI